MESCPVPRVHSAVCWRRLRLISRLFSLHCSQANQNWGKIQAGHKSRDYWFWPKVSLLERMTIGIISLFFTCFFSPGWQVSYLLCCHARAPNSSKVFTATGTQHRAVVSWPEGKVAFLNVLVVVQYKQFLSFSDAIGKEPSWKSRHVTVVLRSPPDDSWTWLVRPHSWPITRRPRGS